MECSKEIGWGSLSPISMWMVHVVIFSHNFLVPFITNPLSDEKTELEQLGRVQGHGGNQWREATIYIRREHQ